MIRAFVEQLGSIGPHRMASLSAEGTVSDWFVLVGPDRPAGDANRAVWFDYTGIGNLWAWYVCTPDQEGDVARIAELDEELLPDGWVLNIEKALENADLTTLITGVKANTGSPIVASLGGFQSASHASLDYRTLDRAGVQVDWQAYIDSGEGPAPAEAVAELYRSSFVIPGWEYRSRIGTTYGWGKVTRCAFSTGDYAIGYYDAYKYPGPNDYEFRVEPQKEWGWAVIERNFAYTNGLLLGRARYSKIAVTLDVTRDAQTRRDLAGWEALAASAKVPGASKRPISCYLAEVASDEVLRAIARGAA